MFRVLNDHQVDYVVVGALAAYLVGALEGFTYDADICPARTPENAARLAAALDELDARVYAAGEEPQRFPFDAKSLTRSEIWNLTTSAGRLDVMFSLTAFQRGFDDLAERAETWEVAPGIEVRIAAPEDILRSKEAAGRPKDVAHLEYLRTYLHERDRAPSAEADRTQPPTDPHRRSERHRGRMIEPPELGL